MAQRLYKLEEGQCRCTVADAKVGDRPLPVTEISEVGALVDTGVEFAVNEYIDVSVDFPGHGDEALFAHVIDSGPDGLRLRWLHFDPGEADRLRATLSGVGERLGLTPVEIADDPADDAPKRTRRETRRVVRPRASGRQPAGTGASRKGQTRRVTRPSQQRETAAPPDSASDTRRHKTETITPFGGGGSASPREGSRRVVRPAGPPPAEPTPSDPPPPTATNDDDLPAGDAPAVGSGSRQALAVSPGDAGPGEESAGRHVVIEATGAFAKRPAGGESGPAAGETSGTQRRHIVGDDGKLDVGASIRSRAKTVRASELAARHDKVRVLNMSTIKELIQDAVGEAVERLGGAIDANERQRLLREAEDEFQERLKAFQAEKQGWEAQQKNLESQLQRAEKMLEEERNKVVEADQFTVSAAGMEDLEKRFTRLVDTAIRANGVNDVLADELRGMVGHLLDEERERIAEHEQQAQNDAISLLERKVQRLAGSLEESEKEAKRQARRAAALEKAGGGGVAGQAVFSEFEDEEDKARKMELLKVVFEQNKEMRSALKDQGVTIKPRTRPAPPPSEVAEVAEVAADEVEQEAAPAAEAAEAPADAEGADDPGDLEDPDDLPWTPGTRIRTDVAGDHEDADEAGGVKKIAAATGPAIPSLAELRAQAGMGDSQVGDTDAAATAATVEASHGSDSMDDTDGLGDPDDMPWQPGMSVTSEPAGDHEDDDGGVRKIAAYKDIEPPPLPGR